jgi:hypothetical protein
MLKNASHIANYFLTPCDVRLANYVNAFVILCYVSLSCLQRTSSVKTFPLNVCYFVVFGWRGVALHDRCKRNTTDTSSGLGRRAYPHHSLYLNTFLFSFNPRFLHLWIKCADKLFIRKLRRTEKLRRLN